MIGIEGLILEGLVIGAEGLAGELLSGTSGVALAKASAPIIAKCCSTVLKLGIELFHPEHGIATKILEKGFNKLLDSIETHQPLEHIADNVADFVGNAMDSIDNLQLEDKVHDIYDEFEGSISDLKDRGVEAVSVIKNVLHDIEDGTSTEAFSGVLKDVHEQLHSEAHSLKQHIKNDFTSLHSHVKNDAKSFTQHIKNDIHKLKDSIEEHFNTEALTDIQNLCQHLSSKVKAIPKKIMHPVTKCFGQQTLQDEAEEITAYGQYETPDSYDSLESIDLGSTPDVTATPSWS